MTKAAVVTFLKRSFFKTIGAHPVKVRNQVLSGSGLILLPFECNWVLLTVIEQDRAQILVWNVTHNITTKARRNAALVFERLYKCVGQEFLRKEFIM